MKIFLDTANVNEIKEAAALGVLDGVTTNPSLVAKEGKDFRKLLGEICAIVDGPISAEVVATDVDDISHEGMQLIEQIVTIYKNYAFATEVLVASVRHPMHVVEAALIGAHVC